MFERRRELALYATLKGQKLLRLYQKTGNEFYKALADYYLDISEALGPSKLFNNVVIERKPAPFEVFYTN